MHIVATIEGVQVTSAIHARHNLAGDGLRGIKVLPAVMFEVATVEGGNSQPRF